MDQPIDERDTMAGGPPPDYRPAIGLHQVTWLRTLVAAVAIAGMAGFTFLVTTAVRQVPVNTTTIENNCEARNRQLGRVNAKFAQLDLIFEASIADRAARGMPVSQEVLDLYADYKKPIELESCKTLNG